MLQLTRSSLWCVHALMFAATPCVWAQTSASVRVIVRDSAGRRLANASVTLMRPGVAPETAGTDSTGTVRITRDTASFPIAVRHPGFRGASALVRSRRAVSAPDSMVVVLRTAAAGELSEVRVVVQDSSFEELTNPQILSASAVKEDWFHGLLGMAGFGGPDGTLASVVRTAAGYDVRNGGISVLGLPGGSNQFRVAGLTLPVARLPAGVAVTGRAFSGAEATRGGFAGAGTDLNVLGGSNFDFATVSVAASGAPLSLAAADPATGGPRYQFGADLSGPIVRDRWYGLVALQANGSRSRRPTALGLAASPAEAAMPDAQRDTLRRLFRSLGISAADVAVDDIRTLDAVLQLDGRRLAGGAVSSMVVANLDATTVAPTSPWQLPSTGTRRETGTLGWQNRWRRGDRRGTSQVLSLGATSAWDATTPQMSQPFGLVRLGNGAGATALAELGFGGSPTAAWRSDSRSVQASYLMDHRFVSRTSRVAWVAEYLTSRSGQGPVGDALPSALVFPDLTALAAGALSILQRDFASRRATAMVSVGGVGADAYRYFRYGTLSVGARFDAQTIAGELRTEARQDAFRSVLPVAFSPRLRWRSDFLDVGREVSVSWGVSAGRYVSWVDPAGLAGSLQPGGTRSATCGPFPSGTVSWASGQVTATCPATSETRTAESRLDVAMAPSSVRANAFFDVQLPAEGSHWAFVEVTVSDTKGLSSTRDVNAPAVTGFLLGDEAGRPVLAPAGAFSAQTGAQLTPSLRPDATRGAVLSSGSDGRSRAVQVSAGLRAWDLGPFPGHRIEGSATYTIARDRVVGIADGRTAGGVGGGLEGAASLAPRWSIKGVYTWYREGMKLFAAAEITDGMRFTPRVDRDINGDGFANDAAFVPRLDQSGALARALRDLAATAGPRVRDCLERNQGVMAVVGSCATPPMALLDVRAELEGWRVKLPARWKVLVDAINVPALLDAITSRPGQRRGWGRMPVADPTLLRVTGFDSAGQRFRYAVNPQFGDASATAPPLAPFSVRVEVRVPLTPPVDLQAARRLAADRSLERRRRTVADLAEQRFLDPFDALEDAVEERAPLDSATRGALEAARLRFLSAHAALWASATRSVVSDTGDANRLRVVLDAASEATGTLYDEAVTEIARILGSARMAELPSAYRLMLRPGYRHFFTK